MHALMLKARVLEERLIQAYRQGLSYFWIGGPGEEAFGVPLGLLVRKGCGFNYDWLHLHYRASSTLVAMGMPPEEALRLAMSRATDSHSKGRNFASHFCVKKWNVAPINSVVASQYSMALGTAYVQSQSRGDSSVTVVTGGDAGTAQGDFASCLVWATRPAQPLPLLITVQNNRWGISTPYADQHSEKRISDRGRAFGIKTFAIDGRDPVESYLALKEAIQYIRKTRRPVLMEARVSRLYGHSSASGAGRVPTELCPVEKFEERLIKHKLITKAQCQEKQQAFYEDIKQTSSQVCKEPAPSPSSVWEDIYPEEKQ